MTTLLAGGSAVRGEPLDDDVDLARDRILVTRAQDGDRAAFDDLYLRYYRRLYRFCLRRLHDTHEAEDVAQEAFSRAWRALPDFGGDRRFYPWLSVIASHLCTDVLRRRNRSTPVAEFHQGNIASNEDDGEELMLASVDCEMVARAFQRLSERHQRILNLREGSGWSYQRIADHEGVGITAVETLLWRARQALKREFAALAGADGRLAGLAGGVFSLSMLRRIFRVPVHAARRMGHLGPATAVALGSAAAATAVMVVTGVGSPPPPAPLPAVSSPSVVAAGVAAPAPPAGGPLGPSARSLAPSGARSGANAANVAPLVPAVPSLPLLPGSPPSSVPGLPGAARVLGSVRNTAGNAASNLGNTAAGAPEGTALAPVGSATNSVLDALLNAGPGASSSTASNILPGTAPGGTGLLPTLP